MSLWQLVRNISIVRPSPLNTTNQRQRQYILLVLGGAWLAAHLCFWLLPRVFEAWNAQTMDQLFVLRDVVEHLRPAYDDTLVHVDLNDSSRQQLGNFYLNRTQYAQVVHNLTAMHVAVQMHDLIFAEPSNMADDQALIDATAAAGPIYYGLALSLEHRDQTSHAQSTSAASLSYLQQTVWQVVLQGDPRGFYRGTKPLLTFPTLASTSRGLGYLSVKPDHDGVFRRLPLLVRYGDAFYPSFALRGICDYLHVTPEKIVVHPGTHILLQDAQRPDTPTPHNIVIPIDYQGNMLINYVGPWERLKHYHFADILRASQDHSTLAMWTAELAGKIVVIADVATGSSDIGPIPFDANFPLSGLHTNAMHTILTEQFLRELSPAAMFGVEAVLVVGAFVLAWWLSSLWFIPAMLAMVVGYGGFVAVGFVYGHFLAHVIRPLLMLIFAASGITVVRYIAEKKARDFIRRVFGVYVPAELLAQIEPTQVEPALGGKAGVHTAYFTDIASFSSFSEVLSATRVVDLLLEYLTAMTDILQAEHGTLDKYEGDAIVAFFGAPVSLEDHAARALRTALKMQQELARLREQWTREGDKWPDLVKQMRMRIGIHSGEFVTGNMGSRQRMNYTMMGDVVNTAARLEAAAKHYGIYIHCTTHTLELAGPDDFEWRVIDKVKVVGRAEAVETVEIMAQQGQLPPEQAHMRMLYHRGLEFYRQQQWDEALVSFTESEKLEEVFPQRPTTPSRVYIERCKFFKANPPGPAWDGSWTLTSK
jgi:adenylate cyclase